VGITSLVNWWVLKEDLKARWYQMKDLFSTARWLSWLSTRWQCQLAHLRNNFVFSLILEVTCFGWTASHATNASVILMGPHLIPACHHLMWTHCAPTNLCQVRKCFNEKLLTQIMQLVLEQVSHEYKLQRQFDCHGLLHLKSISIQQSYKCWLIINLC